jgi:hypothetical protein
MVRLYRAVHHAYLRSRGQAAGGGRGGPWSASLSGIFARMRSCWKRDRWPAYRWGGVDRGCPLGTGIVRPVWHANGTDGNHQRGLLARALRAGSVLARGHAKRELWVSEIER